MKKKEAGMKLIHDDEIETLRALPDIIRRFCNQIQEESLDVKRSADAWTIREHLYHIADVQKMLLGRIETIKNSERPVIEPYFPENDLGCAKYSGTGDALDHYAAVRKLQIVSINSCTDEQLAREASHKEYRTYTIPVILKHMIFHEYWHMYRIEELWLERDEYFRG